LTKNLYWTEDKKLNWRFNFTTLAEKYTEFVSNAIKFGKFEGETLFIAGAKSNYILPQDELLIRQQFPKYQLVTIENAGIGFKQKTRKILMKQLKIFVKEF
jgi:hypothetical protein